MRPDDEPPAVPGIRPGPVAAAVVDHAGVVVRWSSAARSLVGRGAEEVCGRSLGRLLVPPLPPPFGSGRGGGDRTERGAALLRHSSGRTVEVAYEAVPLAGADEYLVTAVPAADAAEWARGASLMRALFAQSRVGIGIHDTDLNVVRTNITPEMFGGPPLPVGSRLGDVLDAEDAEAVERVLRDVLETGEPAVRSSHLVRARNAAGQKWVMSLTAFQLQDARGRPDGVVVAVNDTTAQEKLRDQIDLLHTSANRIGSSLDVVRTAQDLADVVVPDLGDVVTVDLSESVPSGEEPPPVFGGGRQHLTRAAVATSAGGWQAGLLGPGEPYPPLPDSRALRGLQEAGTLLTDRDAVIGALGGDDDLIRLLVPERAHSVLVAVLRARGRILGTVSVWRTDRRPEPFDESDRRLLAEIASRAALGVENARRYTHEHRAAVALQEQLLPRPTTDLPAVETAGSYRPAEGEMSISGDWFDVIALPSSRVALVIGDVIGHGLHATATMGRLRTAIQAFGGMELPPEEVLGQVDDLVQRLAAEAPPGRRDVVGATCLYALYDPVSGLCTFASAGQPPPVLVRPGSGAEFLDVPPGPPLGVGGVPFESVTVELEPDTVLALYTDGLFGLEGFDVERAMARIKHRLDTMYRPGAALDEVGRSLLSGVGDEPPADDLAVLLARTRTLSSHDVASWEFPAGPASVAVARAAAVRQLSAWGLDELALTTELVVSELVTNAVRYAGGPVGLRLIRENVLICEVTDPSNTQPRLLRAADLDEGGRGLFIVANCTTRWGSRYGRSGKTIWTEQPFRPRPADEPALLPLAG
ncbi:SpoIIE family protein phosphatase [Streptomyces liangshanensis]|uniref:SpoIIE family protein phosphatase n=1 Tax=Streptomyces liangshanensis TaxID=2717324 RepID=A0A6G9GSF5_9ACTN|nr:SpoIIE family protein phosphatase [Streptomyces liangshanensis]QIQ01193.1 SpoIIE family protein phosphatase [Streptomyces liangshanensis]